MKAKPPNYICNVCECSVWLKAISHAPNVSPNSSMNRSKVIIIEREKRIRIETICIGWNCNYSLLSSAAF